MPPRGVLPRVSNTAGRRKEFLEAGASVRLAGNTARAATSSEVTDLRRETRALKEVVPEQAPELCPLKKMIGDRGRRRYLRFREVGDHPPGRTIAPAGPANLGYARYPADDVLSVVCCCLHQPNVTTNRQRQGPSTFILSLPPREELGYILINDSQEARE